MKKLILAIFFRLRIHPKIIYVTECALGSIELKNYIRHCARERKLSENTLKSYRIVLNKFRRFVRKNMQIDQIQEVTKEVIRVYLEHLNESWKSSTARHHINVVQGFFSYLEENEISPIIEAGGHFFIQKCTNAYDQTATAERKSKLAQQKKTEAFRQIYEPYQQKYQIRLPADLWKNIDFSAGEGCSTDNFFTLYHSYFSN